MKLLDRKLLRELYQAKGLLLAITSIIAVGVMCYVSMQSAYHNLSRAKFDYYRQCRMADFWVDAKKIPLPELDAVAAIPGVSEIESRIRFFATVDLENVVAPLNGLVLSMPEVRKPTINDVVLRRGGYFTDRRANEVIVNDAFAREHRLGPGQSIHLLLNNRRQELFIVGTAIGSEFTYLLGPGSLVPDPEHFGVFYVKRGFAEEVFDFEGAANQVVGRLAPDVRDRPDDVLRRIETVLDPYGVASTTPLRLQASNQFLSGEIDGLGAFATVVPTIFLVVAALVLNVLINRLARQQRVVVGTLKAVGYSDGHVFRHFLKFGLSVGVLGGLVGSGLGYLAAWGMTVAYRSFFEFPDLSSRFHWYTHGVGISVSLLCAICGTIYGARQMLRLHPAESMRPEPPRVGRRVWLERVSFVWTRLNSAWRLAFRDMARHRVRTGVGIFAAAMGAGLLTSGFLMVEATYFLLDFQFQRISRSDVDLQFADERGRDALEEVARLPGVDLAEPLLAVGCTFVHGPYRRKGGVTGVLPYARLTVPTDASGRKVQIPDSGVLVTRELASILHVRRGQRITMVPVRGERRPVELMVADVVDSYMGLVVYADIDYLSGLIGEEFAVTGAQLKLDGNAEHLTRLYRELKRLPGIQAVASQTDMVETLTKTVVDQQMIFIGVLVGFSGIIFFGSVVNASMVSLAERQREVATFLALGYDHWRLGAMFLRESMTTTLVGALVGLPLGYFLMVLTANSYENEMIRLPIVTAPWVWATTMILAVFFAAAAHAVVQWRIFKMNFTEALKVKE